MVGKIWAWVVRGAGTIFTLFALILAFLAQACAGADSSKTESVDGSDEGLQSTPTFSISLPDNMTPASVAVAAADDLRLADRSKILGKHADTFGRTVNTGRSGTQIGPDAKLGSLWAGQNVSLGPRSKITGDLVAAGSVSRNKSAVVTGMVRERTPITPLRVSSWTPNLPAQTGGSASLECNKERTLPPGGYKDAHIKSRATLRLSHGIYLFDELDLQSQSKLSVDDRQGPVVVYVRHGFTFRGSVIDAGAQPDDKLNLLVVVQDGCDVPIDAPFKGTVFAPSSKLHLGPLHGQAHFGAFLGRKVEIEPDTIINHRPFAWNTVLPPERVEWNDSPVVLKPAVSGDPALSPTSEVTPPSQVPFTIPRDLWVASGNAGNGTAELTFKQPNGTQVVCTYKGGASVLHPVTDLDRAKGRRYLLVSCDRGFGAGGSAIGTWFRLKIVSSDPQAPETAIQLSLGKGCSGALPPPIYPADVVAMREKFDWRTIDALAETDPEGHPALWHGLVYIERKEQLAALDRWRVKWSTSPFSETYVKQYSDRCGRMEHASDGRGVVVFAIFPAKLFNLLRNFGIEATLANVAAPFKFMIPSSPDEPEFLNSDGSLKYTALASTGYTEWLAAAAAQHPSWLGDLVDDVADATVDAAIWVGENIIEPVEDAIDDGLSYVSATWDHFVDWVANAVDDVWETVQEGLGTIIGVFKGHVDVTINVKVTNRDAQLGTNRQMVRAWGAPAIGGKQPFIIPHGVMVRIRQWGWGFLPTLSEEELDSTGTVTISALEDTQGRGEDELCIELDSDDGSITTDLIPNEVCNFYGPNFDAFDHDTNQDLWSNQPELHAFAQIVDSADHARETALAPPEKVDVLTGSLANDATSLVNGQQTSGKERPMALCLDFPSINSASIAGLLGPIYSPFFLKDIWWPDVGEAVDSRVMTHEYGHFFMCSMFYQENGPSALAPLIARVTEGQNDSRDDKLAIATEAFADTFAMEVMGGANYIEADGATDKKIKYCRSGGSCLDFNYKGNSDYPHNSGDKFGFYDELARLESTMHDVVDRGDSQWWHTNSNWNGDVWATGADGILSISPSPFIAFDDENVSMSAGGWRDWVATWVENGPDVSPEGVLNAMNETMHGDYYHYNWCDRCEVFALHDADTPMVDGHADKDGIAMLMMSTPDARWQRYKTCADGKVDYFHDTPPDPYANINAKCEACPNLQFADWTSGGGACTPCKTGEVARGDTCLACPAGTTPGANNECTSCPDYQISVGGVCTACPFGMGADRSTNTCVECPADATLDLTNVTLDCGSNPFHIDVPTTEPANDICKQTIWLELKGLGKAAAKGRTVDVFPVPEMAISGNVSQAECPNLAAIVRAFNLAPAGSGPLWSQFDQSGSGGVWGICNDPMRCDVNDTLCTWASTVSLQPATIAASSNRIRLQASANRLGSPLPVRVEVQVSRDTNIGCEPE